MTEPTEIAEPAAVALAKAGRRWAAALRAHRLAAPNPEFTRRLREFAAAAAEEARACRRVHDAGLLWRPMPGAERAEPPYELRRGTARPGGPELWKDFDAAILRLNRAVGQSDALMVGTAFAALAEAAEAIVEELEHEDMAAASRQQRRAG